MDYDFLSITKHDGGGGFGGGSGGFGSRAPTAPTLVEPTTRAALFHALTQCHATRCNYYQQWFKWVLYGLAGSFVMFILITIWNAPRPTPESRHAKMMRDRRDILIKVHQWNAAGAADMDGVLMRPGLL